MSDQWRDNKYPQGIAQRIRGRDGADPHMDGSATVTFSKYEDRPGTFSARISPELSDLLCEASDALVRLEGLLAQADQIAYTNACDAIEAREWGIQQRDTTYGDSDIAPVAPWEEP